MAIDDSKIEKKILKSVNARFDSVECSYRKFRNNPYSIEYVHRLRVELRKTRAILSFLKPILDREVYDEINQIFREMGKVFSRKRDVDALIDGIQNVAIEEPELLINYSEIFGYLEEQRLEEGHIIADRKILSSFDKDLENVKDKLSMLKLYLDQSKESSLESYIQNRYKKKGKKLKKAYQKIDLNDYDAIHELRKTAKKVRYAAVGFKSILPKKIRKPIKKEAKIMQEELGQLTDSYMSIEMLTHYKEKVGNIQLKGSFQKLIDYHTTEYN